jgi:hypothetical protein
MKVQLRQVETHQPAEIKHLAAALPTNALHLEVARDNQPAQNFTSAPVSRHATNTC